MRLTSIGLTHSLDMEDSLHFEGVNGLDDSCAGSLSDSLYPVRNSLFIVFKMDVIFDC